MITIGLTGGIGSGKTTVANFFLELGIAIYFADIEAKKLMQSSKIIRRKLLETFGKEAYIKGALNSTYLSAIVFNNPNKLKLLNEIVHPEVAKHFTKWVKNQTSKYIIQENAILFENNTDSKFDYIITVTAPLATKIERVIQRDSTTKKKVLSRINNQWSDQDKIELSDFVIYNLDKNDTKVQVRKIHEKILKICKKLK